jgi:cellulose synthase/poly-beta-1,6-N-acetylglucosamine synthase-like glycosyltransferase
MNRKLVSVIVPAYNEEDCIGELASQLKKVFAENNSYDFEALIIETFEWMVESQRACTMRKATQSYS